MAKILDLVKIAMWNYPTLYGDDQYSLYRVLDHLFLVIGNGYGWQGGQMEALFDDEIEPISMREHNEKIAKYYKWESQRSTLDEWLAGAGSPQPEPTPLRFYPIFSYSMVVTMPDDVDDDTLLWALRLLEYAVNSPIEYFLGPKPYVPEKEKAFLTEFREYFLFRWQDRIAALSDEWRLH